MKFKFRRPLILLFVSIAFIWFLYITAIFISNYLPSTSTVIYFITAWSALEISWYIYFRTTIIHRLATFRPEDSCKSLTKRDVDLCISDIVYLLETNAARFWSNVTGINIDEFSKGKKLPIATAKSFLNSIFMIFPECTIYKESSQKLLYQIALQRIETASNGFDHNPTTKSMPNLIRGWYDDNHIKKIVRSSPLIVITLSYLCLSAVIILLYSCGWKCGHYDATTGMECWILKNTNPGNINQPKDKKKPLVLFPGAGAGLLSFLPLLLQIQFGQRRTNQNQRDVVVYRFPWVEVGRFTYTFPQWTEIINGIRESLHVVGIDEKFDLVAHSYGTIVAGRLLRHLCSGESSQPFLCIDYLAMLDPVLLGGASCGLISQLNHAGPDLSFGFAANRAGVFNFEILNYNPQLSGQCMTGMSFYLSNDDVLVDVGLAQHILETYKARKCPQQEQQCSQIKNEKQTKVVWNNAHLGNIELVVDTSPNSFHGRWLIDFWCINWWDRPCATKAMAMMNPFLHLVDEETVDVQKKFQ